MKNITKVTDPTSQAPKGSAEQVKIITGQHTVKGPQKKKTKTSVNWTSSKLKSAAFQDTIQKTNDKPQNGRRYSQITHMIRNLYLGYIKHLQTH